MDVGIAQFWGGIAVVALTSVVNIIITLYKASMTSKNIKENIKANMDSLERELRTKVGVEVLSKNRQEWVKDLRKQIASFVSQVDSSIVNIPKKYALIRSEILKKHGKRDDETYELDKDGSIEFLEFVQDITLNLNCLLINVELMLNPNEENNKKVIKLMVNICSSVSDFYYNFFPSFLQEKNMTKEQTKKQTKEQIKNTSDLIMENCTELKVKVHEILKTEWERVKKGI